MVLIPDSVFSLTSSVTSRHSPSLFFIERGLGGESDRQSRLSITMMKEMEIKIPGAGRYMVDVRRKEFY